MDGGIIKPPSQAEPWETASPVGKGKRLTTSNAIDAAQPPPAADELVTWDLT